MVTGPGGSAPSGGVRFAPSGTFGAGAVSAGASDAGFPSSADADSVCAETDPVQSDAASAAPATTAIPRVTFITFAPLRLDERTGLPWCTADESRTSTADDPQQTLLLFTKGT